jgi:CBS domain-containing protein
MTEPVLTVAPDDRVGNVAGAMAAEGIKSVVVIDEACRPEGILTSSDFVEIATAGPAATDAPVSDHMTTGVYTVSVDEPVTAAVEAMLAEEISHLPVVEDDEVVGILSMTDVVADRVDAPAAN